MSQTSKALPLSGLNKERIYSSARTNVPHTLQALWMR
jgi:hypothetical protein